MLLSRMGAQVNQVRRFGFVLVVIMCLREDCAPLTHVSCCAGVVSR